VPACRRWAPHGGYPPRVAFWAAIAAFTHEAKPLRFAAVLRGGAKADCLVHAATPLFAEDVPASPALRAAAAA
jgi:hypothetical protein